MVVADPAAWLTTSRLSGPLVVSRCRRIDDLAAWQRLALEQLQLTAGPPPFAVSLVGWQRRRRVLLAQIEEVRRCLTCST